MSFEPVDSSDDVGPHAHGGLVGGADGGGAVGLHGLNPRCREDRGAFVVSACDRDPLGALVGLGDPVILVVFVVFPPSREKDSAVEPSVLFFGGGPETLEGGGDARGQVGGVSDDGGLTGDSKLESE